MKDWTPQPDGSLAVIRRGVMVAKVNAAGNLWRGTVFLAEGTSSHTWLEREDAQIWCEETWLGIVPIR